MLWAMRLIMSGPGTAGHDRVFLLRGSDPARPGITWWLTPGGGLHDGESPRDGALRETAEETGWSAQAGAHACLRRDVEFTFMAKRYRQREVFYPARVGGAEDLDRSRWTMEECQSLLEGRWWTVQELRDTGDTIYPEQLADLAESLIREGWE